MLRIVQSNSVAGAKSYYTEGLAREDYYTRGSGQEIIGRWGGRGAARLGLEGQVTHEAFASLCENRHPATGERLTQRNMEGRKVGYDVNWHAPKSFSVLYALTKDERLLTAFRDAVDATMREMEEEIRVRVRKGRQNGERTTGEGVWAEFIHFTARPVGGVPDPHVHAHCFLQNASYDKTENAWKAADIHVLKEQAPYFEAAMHSRLARSLTDLGLGVQRTAKGWEVAGVPETIVSKFSRRTAQIEEEAKRRGIDDPHAKDDLGRKTRERKASSLTMEELRQEWVKRISPEERQALKETVKLKAGKVPKVSQDAALDHAALQSFERQSVVPERRLLAAALRYGVGSVEPEGMKAAMKDSRWVSREVDGKRLVTTRAVLAEEEKMLAFARDGRGACLPFGGSASGRSGDVLNRGQAAVMEHVLNSKDRVILVRGVAGTGKTTLMRSVVAALEETGKKVIPVAPTADAARGVLRQDGFEGAETVAKLLVSREMQQELKGNVLWVDEAGLVGSHDMGRLFELAKAQGARVILTGDAKQHSPVPRCDALRVLESHAGLPAAELRSIVRQKGEYAQAVGALSRGDTAEGFDQLDRMGWVREIADKGKREEALAAEYVAAIRDGASVLAIAPTHAEGRSVTAAVRGALLADGKLGGEERAFRSLVTDAPAEADRRDAAFYRPGMVVEFHLPAKGFKPGQRYEVVGLDDRGSVMVHQGKGPDVPLPLEHAPRFQVYEPSELRLRQGDRLRIAKNGKTADGRHGVNRGAIYEVAGFTDAGDVKLGNGWELSKEFAHWSHGYVLTSHAAQGKTVDRVLLAESEQSLPVASREQLYVSASRARHSVTVFTDDKAELKRAVQSSSERLSAAELAARPEQKEKGALARHAERIAHLAELARTYASQKVADTAERYARMRGRQQQRER